MRLIIERFRAVLGKNHPFIAVAVEQIAQKIPAGKHPFGERNGKFVSAPAGVGATLHGGEHGVLHRIGLRTARSGMVEINHNHVYSENQRYSIIRRQENNHDNVSSV